MKALLLAVLLTPFFTYADPDSVELPFEPAITSNQSEITPSGIREEVLQFRFIEQWKKANAHYAIVQLNFAQAEREYNRAKELHDKGIITEVKYAAAYLAYRTLQDELIRLPLEIVQTRVEAEFHRLRVIEEGNPQADHRARLLKLVIDGAHARLNAINSSLELAKLSNEFAQKRLEHGRELIVKRGITPQELEQRELAARTAEALVAEIEMQLEIVRMALPGFERSLARCQTDLSS
jgi:hypothetical protein